jgi:hypothetical protein
MKKRNFKKSEQGDLRTLRAYGDTRNPILGRSAEKRRVRMGGCSTSLALPANDCVHSPEEREDASSRTPQIRSPAVRARMEAACVP